MNTVLIFQGKGSVGKSPVAVLLAQYGKSKDGKVICTLTQQLNLKLKTLNRKE